MAKEFPIRRILDRFTGKATVDETVTDMPCVKIGPDALVELCLFLRDDKTFRFDFLSDIAGVDFHPEVPRFELVYHLFSLSHGWRLRVKCRLGDPPTAPTVTDIWATANFHERESYDMYGIHFDAHPDLRRIYMWDEFEGFPMRKDFPLRGYKDAYNPLGVDKKGEGGQA